MEKGSARLILYNLVGPLIFFCCVALLLYIVPWTRIREFARLGIIGGFGGALVIILLMQNRWGFWLFHQVDLVDFYRLPVTLSLTWVPLVIIYCFLLVKYERLTSRLVVLAIFPAGATLFHFLLLKGGFLTYYHWNLTATFLLSIAVHLVILGYLFRIHIRKSKTQI